MPYTITLTNGTLLTTVADDSVDTTTSIGLVGRSYLGYGQTIATDLVHMLENFSSGTPPKSPLVGQLWYDNGQGDLNLWNGLAWQRVTGSGGGGNGGNGGSGSDQTWNGNLSNSSTPIPSDTAWSQIFTRDLVIDQTANGGHLAFNTYLSSGPTWRYRANGPAGLIWLDNNGGLQFLTMSSGNADDAWSGSPTAQLQLASTGNLSLIDGDFVISRSKSWANLWLQKSASTTANQIIGCTGNSMRWVISPGDTADEIGNNLGSNFAIYRFNDAGAVIDAPFWIQRGSGVINHTTAMVQGDKGISYTIAPEGPVHRIGFGWNGSAGVLMVDGTNTGSLATQAYVSSALGAYLPLTGGTITGSLVATGNVTANGSLIANAIKSNGDINATANLVGNQLITYNAVYPSYSANSQFYIASNSNDVIFNFQSGWWLGWRRTDGRLRFVNGSSELFVCDGSGNGAFMGNLLTDNGLYVQNSGYILYQGTDGSRHIQFSSDNWGLTWRSTDGTLYFSRWDGVTLWQCDPNGNTIIPGNSYAAAYPGPCDKRLKKDIKPFNAGLAELLKLKPASWRYNGSGGVNDDGRRHAGLHAQDLETVIPECVLVMPEKQTANGETVTYPDQLAADTAPILAAVINALHEISERLAALEAKHE